jgi:hypothetical protein
MLSVSLVVMSASQARHCVAGWGSVHGLCSCAGDVAVLSIPELWLLSVSPELNPESPAKPLQLRRWDEEGGMPVLVGTERFVSRPMSGGYRHPDIIRCARTC